MVVYLHRNVRFLHPVLRGGVQPLLGDFRYPLHLEALRIQPQVRQAYWRCVFGRGHVLLVAFIHKILPVSRRPRLCFVAYSNLQGHDYSPLQVPFPNGPCSLGGLALVPHFLLLLDRLGHR